MTPTKKQILRDGAPVHETAADSGGTSRSEATGLRYYRDFLSLEVVWPADSSHARRLGTEWVTVDTVIMPPASERGLDVFAVVSNRRIENLPAGPKWPAEWVE